MLIPMSDADDLAARYMLALCVWREARGESMRGKQLVAQVIKNRSTDGRWPHDITSVIVQPFQFSSFNPNDPNARDWPRPADVSWFDSVSAADSVLQETAPFSPANHYHAIGITPSWADSSKITETEGHHIFYRL